jgi:hypothetical protein
MIVRIDYSDEEATNAKIGWPNIVQALDGNLRSGVPGNPNRLSGGFLCFKKVANMAKQKERQNPTNKSTDQTDEKKPNLGDFAAKKLVFQGGANCQRIGAGKSSGNRAKPLGSPVLSFTDMIEKDLQNNSVCCYLKDAHRGQNS